MTQTPEVSKSHQTGAPSSSAGLLSSSKLTFRQQEVFDLLVAYINQHGYPPTLTTIRKPANIPASGPAGLNGPGRITRPGSITTLLQLTVLVSVIV